MIFDDFSKHTRGRRRFLPIRPGIAIMLKGTIAQEVLWKPIQFLGRQSGFYRPFGSRLWHLSIGGRRIW